MKFMRFLPYSYAARMSLQILSLGLCGCLLKKMPLERMYLPLVVGSLYHTLYVLYCVIAKRFSDMRILWESPTLWESPNCSSGKETTISISSVALSIHVSRSQNYNCFTSNSAGACTRQTAKWNYHTCWTCGLKFSRKGQVCTLHAPTDPTLTRHSIRRVLRSFRLFEVSWNELQCGVGEDMLQILRRFVRKRATLPLPGYLLLWYQPYAGI